MEREILSTRRKALQLNLNSSIYGAFAEIGAGQETARCFFQAGGASGTVAKTISAYDKAFSDAIYHKGKVGRYVSEGRLIKMLNREYNETHELLADKRSEETCFFAFANTVTTLNYQKTNEGHGWLGMRFQLNPGSEPNEVILHTRLLESDGLLQQNTLGVLGVNLIYACYYYHEWPNTFLQSLMDNLSPDRIEVNMCRMSGPELDYVDNRLLSVQLVKNGMTNVTMFDRYGKVQQPSDMLYKKNVMALRGSFRPITYVGFDMLKTGFSLFKKDTELNKKDTVVLCEMTLNNLLAEGDFDERDFLSRADILCGMGQNVMISNFREYYKLVAYLSNFKIRNLRMIMGTSHLQNIIDEKYYSHLKGGTLEAFGRLFMKNLKIYVYPWLDKENNKILTSKSIPIPEEIKYLYKHLEETDKICDITRYQKKWLGIYSYEVLEQIKQGDESWIEKVPVYISEAIKKNGLFGCK